MKPTEKFIDSEKITLHGLTGTSQYFPKVVQMGSKLLKRLSHLTF